MGSNATASTAGVSMGAGGAVTVILVWLISLAHVTVPSDVVAAMMVLIPLLIHGGWLKYISDPVPTEPTAMVPVAVEPPAPVVAPAPASVTAFGQHAAQISPLLQAPLQTAMSASAPLVAPVVPPAP